MAGQWGFMRERADYYHLLDRAHFVLSTALHEFQGLAVLEAVMRGCRPLVPDRLSYPEYIAPAFRYPSTPQQPEVEGEMMAGYLAQALASWSESETAECRESVQAFSWGVLGPRYRGEFAHTKREYLRMLSH